MPTSNSSPSSNAGKWNRWYAKLTAGHPPATYGDSTTYLMAAAFMSDLDEVEDWGCGKGGFRLFWKGTYRGVDGSDTPFADKIADLCEYRSRTEGLLLRHVLEHDYRWDKILDNAIQSFEKKMCLILFTPFSTNTTEISHNRNIGVDVPDLSFSQSELEAHLAGLKFKLFENVKTQTQYGVEHVYLIWRSSSVAGKVGHQPKRIGWFRR